MMKWAVFAAAVFVSAGLMPGQDVRRPPTPVDRARVLADGWEVSRDRLAEGLVAAYQPGGPGRPGTTGTSAYRQWMQLWKWSELLARNEKGQAVEFLQTALRTNADGQKVFYGPGRIWPSDSQPASAQDVEKIFQDPVKREKYLGSLVSAEFSDPRDEPLFKKLDPGVVAEWVGDAELSSLLFESLSPQDYAPAVLARLQEIRLAHPGKFREYPALAVALALVYDQALPGFWPHDQVNPQLVPRRDIAVAEFFADWVTSNETRALMLDLRKLRPGQIKFIIDAPLEDAEFVWARKNVRYPRMDFDKAFGSVAYDHDRLKNREYEWMEGTYTLEDLRRKGGICVDQAYYAMIAGKARGLPTLFFSGQGTDGGHAWFGYMKSDDRWELDCGRYENQNYAVGTALDPQTWTPISDHDLEFLAQSFRDKLEFASSQDDLLLAAQLEKNGDAARALKAYESAVQVCPENIAAWEAKLGYLVRSGAAPGQLRSHYEAALRQFPRDRDIRTSQQTGLAAVLRELGDPAAAEALEAQMVFSNKRQRSDLSVNLVAQRLASLAAEKKFDEAFGEYRRQLSGLGKTGGGNFYYEIVEPFAVALLQAGDKKRAGEAVSMAKKVLRPETGSILNHEMDDLTEQIDKAGD